MPELKSIGFVVNPHAGSQKSAIWKDEIRSSLTQAGIRYEIAETQGIQDVGERVRSFTRRHDAVFAVGGDGTAHHVAQGLASGPTPFGLLPNGSGNDYSKMLGMPRGVRTGLDLILKGFKIVSYNAIQLIVVDADKGEPIKRWSINTAGFGFDAAVSEMKTKIPVLRGLPLYLTSALMTLVTYKATELNTDARDAKGYKGLMIAAGIGEFEGGGFKIFPGVSAHDSCFHVCEIREHSKLRALPLLIKAVTGAHVGARRVVMRAMSEIVLTSDVPLPVHADGEVLTLRAKQVGLKLIENALNVLIPNTNTFVT